MLQREPVEVRKAKICPILYREISLQSHYMQFLIFKTLAKSFGVGVFFSYKENNGRKTAEFGSQTEGRLTVPKAHAYGCGSGDANQEERETRSNVCLQKDYRKQD